jgi:hypothetical protein
MYIYISKFIPYRLTLTSYPLTGDTDGDGVLSFTEFKEIFREVAPDWHERRIMYVCVDI